MPPAVQELEALKARVQSKEELLGVLKSQKDPDMKMKANIKLNETELEVLKAQLKKAEEAKGGDRTPSSVSSAASAADESITAKGPGVCAHCDENAPEVGRNEPSNPPAVASQVAEAQGLEAQPSRKKTPSSTGGGNSATGTK